MATDYVMITTIKQNTENITIRQLHQKHHNLLKNLLLKATAWFLWHACQIQNQQYAVFSGWYWTVTQAS